MIKILWIIYFIFYLILSIPSLIKVRIIKKYNSKKAEQLSYLKVRSMAKYILKKSKTDVNISGIENIPDRNCVFVLNHQAIFDGFLVLAYIEKNISLIAKKEIKKIPLISSWFKEINAIFIDRKNLKESVKAIYKGIEMINKGYSMVIFPEGTRSLGIQMNEFKKGSLRLSLKTKVPIVPITLNGTYRILEKGNKVRGNKVEMIIHPPVFTENLSREEEDGLKDKIFNIINEGLKR